MFFIFGLWGWEGVGWTAAQMITLMVDNFGECNKIVADSCCVQIKETGLRHCAIVQELWLPVFFLFGILDDT